MFIITRTGQRKRDKFGQESKKIGDSSGLRQRRFGQAVRNGVVQERGDLGKRQQYEHVEVILSVCI